MLYRDFSLKQDFSIKDKNLLRSKYVDEIPPSLQVMIHFGDDFPIHWKVMKIFICHNYYNFQADLVQAQIHNI